MSNRTAAFTLALLAAVQFLPGSILGLTPYWGDLTYLHHPWRVLPVQLIQQGRLPLWNPYLYFGMPMAASMQSSVFYPGFLPFSFFGFGNATVVFHGLHYWMGGWLMFLWLKRAFPVVPALAGAVLFAFGGGLMSRIPFLNHLAVLSLSPAFFIFFDRPRLLSLSLALGFLAGFPPFLAGAAAGAWLLRCLLATRAARIAASARCWIAASVLAACCAGILLLPAWELVLESRRSAGLDAAEALRFAFEPKDLVQGISPVLVPLSSFDPAKEWWKCSYVGFAALSAIMAGAYSLPGPRALGVLLFLGLVVALVLGGSNSLSLFLWTHAPPLKFLRYPGNFVYLAGPALSLLAARGVSALSRPLLMLILIALELSLYGAWSAPRAPSGIWTSSGPLARRLQGDLGEHRYLLSPRALESVSGNGVEDWKNRLYGLTNAPYRIRSAGNFGEPLVPAGSYRYMDALYSAPDAGKAAELFPWADIQYLLTPGPLRGVPVLSDEGSQLWRLHRYTGPTARAYAFSQEQGAALPAGLPRTPLPSGIPLRTLESREDRLLIEGDFPDGWVYVSLPRFPGWSIWHVSPAGARELDSLPALEAFQKVKVPPGRAKMYFIYRPESWRRGLLLSLMGLAAVALIRRRSIA